MLEENIKYFDYSQILPIKNWLKFKNSFEINRNYIKFFNPCKKQLHESLKDKF